MVLHMFITKEQKELSDCNKINLHIHRSSGNTDNTNNNSIRD